jgi:hypothetical protein
MAVPCPNAPEPELIKTVELSEENRRSYTLTSPPPSTVSTDSDYTLICILGYFKSTQGISSSLASRMSYSSSVMKLSSSD